MSPHQLLLDVGVALRLEDLFRPLVLITLAALLLAFSFRALTCSQSVSRRSAQRFISSVSDTLLATGLTIVLLELFVDPFDAQALRIGPRYAGLHAIALLAGASLIGKIPLRWICRSTASPTAPATGAVRVPLIGREWLPREDVTRGTLASGRTRALVVVMLFTSLAFTITAQGWWLPPGVHQCTAAITVASYASLILLWLVWRVHQIVLALVWLVRADHHPAPRRALSADELPHVTVQLPVYNEVNVVERLIESAGRIDYPRDRLQIQVLDDSGDSTTELVDRLVEQQRYRGVNMVTVRRPRREGYKAGALAHALPAATGEFIAIFDADFVISPGWLRTVIRYFTDESVGFVQARWAHLNRHRSMLTQIQAIGLDMHQAVEQAAKNRAGCWVNFHGTAGIWRRLAIEDSGGWHRDSETEDGDLSYRAAARGWRVIYLLNDAVPAELPSTMRSYVSQQMRWQRGGVQVMKKLLPVLVRARLPVRVRADAFLRLTGPVGTLLGLAVVLMTWPAFRAAESLGITATFRSIYLSVLPVCLFSVGWVYQLACQYVDGRAWRRQPFLTRWWPTLALGALEIGLLVMKAQAFLEGWLIPKVGFERTPKLHAVGKHVHPRVIYRSGKPLIGEGLTVVFGCYALAGAAAFASAGHGMGAVLNLYVAIGFLWVGLAAGTERLGLRPFWTATGKSGTATDFSRSRFHRLTHVMVE